ncbi:MAG: cytochrome c3 family protein [Deltaproteobacteria bacterium]|nr:cytochrome c3 family protein [Deltaproteobacteria bacterium]
MRRHSAVLLTITIIPFLFALPAVCQEDMVVVAGDSFEVQRRPSAVFRHDDHNKTAEIEECNECHHVYESGERITDESSEDQRCADCHTEKSAGNRPGLRKAFHLNCKGCHQSKKQGPVMCGECHARRAVNSE